MFTGLFALGAFWPAAYGVSFVQAYPLLTLLWGVSCLVMSTFTLLPPAMTTESVTLM